MIIISRKRGFEIAYTLCVVIVLFSMYTLVLIRDMLFSYGSNGIVSDDFVADWNEIKECKWSQSKNVKAYKLHSNSTRHRKYLYALQQLKAGSLLGAVQNEDPLAKIMILIYSFQYG